LHYPSKKDVYKLSVFENYKILNRDLNSAFLRHSQLKKLFSKGKGNAVLDTHVQNKKKDEDAMGTISSIFRYMHKNNKTTTSANVKTST
jgi:hypothetical protein